MEQSRPLLEKNGVLIAAVSYDSVEVLSGFAGKYSIGFPLLSDWGSVVIRRFGIFNPNIPSDLRAYGVPHPVDYLVAPDAMVIRKYFVPNYNHRVTASAIALREFGITPGGAATVTLTSGALTVQLGFSGVKAFAGEEVGFFAKFALEPGWHSYGSPLPPTYTATSIAFNDPAIISQSFELPEPVRMELPALGETLPVYRDSFDGLGLILLKSPMEARNIGISGELRFQLCSDTVCMPPEILTFDLPLTVEPLLVPTPRH